MEHTRVTSNEVKKQNITPRALLVLSLYYCQPLPHPPPPLVINHYLLLRLKIASPTSVLNVNRIQYVLICVWLLSLNIILWESSILFCVEHSFWCTVFYLCIHYGHVGGSQFRATTNRATMNIPASIFGIHRHTFLLYIYLEVELLRYGICTFGFSTCCQVVFQRINLHSHQQYENSVCFTSSPTLDNFILVFQVGV